MPQRPTEIRVFRPIPVRLRALCTLCVLFVSSRAAAQSALEDSARNGIFVVFDETDPPLAILGYAPPELGSGPIRSLPSQQSGAGFSSWVIASRAIRRGDVPTVTALAGRAVRVVSATSACTATLGVPIVIGLKDSSVMRWEHELRGLNPRVSGARAIRYAWSNGAHIVVAPIVGPCARAGLIVTTLVEGQVSFYPRAPASPDREASLSTRYEASESGRAMRHSMSMLPADWEQPVVSVRRWSLGSGSELSLVDAPIPESCATSHHTTLFDDRSTPPRDLPVSWGPETLAAVLDLDGDGVLELVFSHDEWWHVTVMRLPVGASTLVPLADVDLRQSMGC